MTILIRNCILTAVVLILPGCLAINALLGVTGFLMTGPIQYAGTVYSVGEYAYEYAVNEKTPDEVIEEKFAWLLETDQAPVMDEPTLVLAKAPTLEPRAVVAPEVQLAETSLDEPPRVTLSPKSLTPEPPRMIASIRPTPRPATPVEVATFAPKKAASAPMRVQPMPMTAEPMAQSPALPQHEYVERTSTPLQIKLDRMEQGLAQAEQLMNQQPLDGIRYSVPSNETGQTGTTLSGSWSIRHAIMQDRPATIVDTADDATMVTAQLS